MSRYDMEYHRDYYRKNRKRILTRQLELYHTKYKTQRSIEQKAAYSESRMSLSISERVYMMINGASGRASRKGMAFDLKDHEEEITGRVAAGKCEMTGVEFDMSPGDRMPRWNAPSIDRIDRSGGYTYKNIRIVIYVMNAAINCWGEEVLKYAVSRWLGMPCGELPRQRFGGLQPAMEELVSEEIKQLELF